MPINRYSDLSVSAYNPMSMEELAMVPMMKRKQHDELDKQLAEAVVKVDPLKYHEDEALRLKNEMEGKVASQSEQLASQGITPDAKSSFYKLNKEYRDLVAPTGQVGKINRAKEIYDKEHATFIKNAMETSKIGGDQAELRWNEHVAKNYTGYEDPEQKRIKYIDPLGAVAHQDHDKDVALAHSILGSYSNQISKAGYNVGQDKTTGLWGVINSKGETVDSDNFKQVNSALQQYSAKWLNPVGEGYKWAEFAGQDIENNKLRAIHTFNSMLKKTHGEEGSTTFNPLAGQGESGDDDGKTSGDFISSETAINPSTNENYTTVLNRIKTIQSKPESSRTDAEKSQLIIDNQHRKLADEKLTKDSNYNKLQSQFLNTQKELEREGARLKIFRKSGESDNNYHNRLYSSGTIDSKVSHLKLALNDISKQRSKIKDAALHKSSILTNEYNFLPGTDSKSQTDYSNFQTNVYSAISKIENLNNVFDVKTATFGNDKVSKIDKNHTDAISSVLKHVNKSTFEINKIIPQGPDGKPQMQISFKLNDDAPDTVIEDTGKLGMFKDKISGEGNVITLNVGLKHGGSNATAASGIQNLSEYMSDYYRGRGNVIGVGSQAGTIEGNHVSGALMSNAYKGLPLMDLAKAASRSVNARDILIAELYSKGINIKNQTEVQNYINKHGKEKFTGL